LTIFHYQYQYTNYNALLTRNDDVGYRTKYTGTFNSDSDRKVPGKKVKQLAGRSIHLGEACSRYLCPYVATYQHTL